MSDHKKRITDALMKFHAKDLREIKKLTGASKPRMKNKKPEKITEEECLEWMRAQGWEVQIIESKAIYNKAAGCYMQNPGVKAGNADCQGIMEDGTSVAIEFKAAGKLSTFLKDKNIAQRDFILRRIHMNGFACVVDSVAMLQTIYQQWDNYRKVDKECAKQFLLSSLPVAKNKKDSTNDSDLFG